MILAAGLSSRLGQPKHLLRVAGQLLIRHTAAALLGAGFDRTLVVVGPGPVGEGVRAALDGLPLDFAVNPQPELGLASSFVAAIQDLGDVEAASFALGDMPLVSADMHRQVLNAYREMKAPLVLARFGPEGVRAPPHLFRADLFSQFTPDGDHGPKHLIRRYAGQAVWLDFPAWALTDLDTLGDVAQMEALLRRHSTVTD